MSDTPEEKEGLAAKLMSLLHPTAVETPEMPDAPVDGAELPALDDDDDPDRSVGEAVESDLEESN